MRPRSAARVIEELVASKQIALRPMCWRFRMPRFTETHTERAAGTRERGRVRDRARAERRPCRGAERAR